jgi:hypothetical protein
MKRFPIFVLFLTFSLTLFSSEFRWTHNYQGGASGELVSLSNKMCGKLLSIKVETEGFTIQRPCFILKGGKGSLYFEQDFNGFYYDGAATLSFSVDNSVESSRLEKAIQKNKIENEVIKGFYVLPFGECPDLPELKESFDNVIQYDKMAGLKSGLRKDCIKNLNYLLNPQMMGKDDLIILFEFKDEIWGYQLNSLQENEVQLLRLSHPPYSDFDMWDPIVSMHITKEGKLTPYINEEEYLKKCSVDVNKYEINFDLDKNGKLNKGEVKVTFLIDKPQRSVLFDLYPAIQVNSVKSDNMNLGFIKEDFSKTYSYYDTSLLIDLGENKKGEITLTFDISGDLFDKAEGYIYLVEEDLWFPLLKDKDGFLFSFKATVPQDFEVLSVGDLKEKNVGSDGKATYLWTIDREISNASFTMGSFTHKRVELDNSSYLDVALPKDLRTNILSQAQEYTLSELKNIFNLYTQVFGELPYKNLKVIITPYAYGRSFKWRGFSTEKMRLSGKGDGQSDMPVVGSRHLNLAQRRLPETLKLSSYGRGFPTLIVLTEDALYRSGESVPEKLLAHQVALNWWDSLVSPLSERDVWLSEGLSEFCALFYLQGRFGEETAKIFRENMLTGGSLAKRGNLNSTIDVDEYPSDKFFSSVKTFSASGENAIPFDDGPIALGTRIYSTLASQPHKSYESIIYTKGAFVFQMLYQLSFFTKEKDAGFLNGLKSICTKYSGKKISTETFFKEMQNSMKIPLTDFYKGWYEINGVPKVDIKTLVTQKEGGYILTAEGRCDASLFFGVPIRAKFAGKKYSDYFLLFQNKSAKSEWKIGEKPKGVDIDPQKVVFCQYGKLK